MDNQQILQELSELIQLYYDGSFSRMVYDYIQSTEITQPEIEKLLEEISSGETEAKVWKKKKRNRSRKKL